MNKIPKIQRSINIYKGSLAEEIVRFDLASNNQWKVTRIQEAEEINGTWITKLSEDVISNLRYLKLCSEIQKLNLKLKTSKIHFPDFICEKDGVIQFVEVKSNKPNSEETYLQKNESRQVTQKPTMEAINNKLGYDVIWAFLPLTYNKSGKEIKIPQGNVVNHIIYYRFENGDWIKRTRQELLTPVNKVSFKNPTLNDF